MIGTKVVELTEIKGIASISRISCEAILTAGTPADVYPPEAFREAMALTAGLPCRKPGKAGLIEKGPEEAPAEKRAGSGKGGRRQ